MRAILLILVGADLDANLRYGINRVTLQWFGGGFPWGTLLVNVAGICLIGSFGTFLEDRAAGCWATRAG